MNNKPNILDHLYNVLYKILLRARGGGIGKKCFFMYRAKIVGKNIDIFGDVFLSRNVFLKAPHIRIGSNSIIFSNVNIICTESIYLGERNKISRNCTIRAYSISSKNDLWINENVKMGGGGWENPSAILDIGPFQFIGENALVNVANRVTLEGTGGIGNNVQIYTKSSGEGQSIFEGYSCSDAPVYIGKNVSVYSSSIILPGVRIEDGSIIGAHSLVRSSVERETFYGGVPAKKIASSHVMLNYEEAYNKAIQFLENICTKTAYSEFCINTSKILLYSTLTQVEVKDLLHNDKVHQIFIIVNGDLCEYAQHYLNATFISLSEKTISGVTTDSSEWLRDKLRQVGTRLKYLNYKPHDISWKKLISRGVETI